MSERQNCSEVASLDVIWTSHSEIFQRLIYVCSNHTGTDHAVPLTKTFYRPNSEVALMRSVMSWRHILVFHISASVHQTVMCPWKELIKVIPYGMESQTKNPICNKICKLSRTRMICGMVNENEPWILATFSTSNSGANHMSLLWRRWLKMTQRCA